MTRIGKKWMIVTYVITVFYMKKYLSGNLSHNIWSSGAVRFPPPLHLGALSLRPMIQLGGAPKEVALPINQQTAVKTPTAHLMALLPTANDPLRFSILREIGRGPGIGWSDASHPNTAQFFGDGSGMIYASAGMFSDKFRGVLCFLFLG